MKTSAILLLLAPVLAFAKPAVNVTVDKLAHEPGETINFRVVVLDDADMTPLEADVSFEIDFDGGQEKERGRGHVTADAPLVVPTSLDRPGFVRFTAKAEVGEARPRFVAGACVRPGELRGIPEPEDFDAFWERQKAIVAAADLSKAVVEDAPESVTSQKHFNGMRVFKVSIPYAEGMQPATAWVVMPAGALPGSIRAIVGQYQGYGIGGGKNPPRWFDSSAITLEVNAHGYELGREEAYYKEFEESVKSNGAGYGFDKAQNASPETCYFRGMLLRDLVLLRWAKTLPEWNGRELRVIGGSQGGFQCVAMAALDPAATYCEPNAPWLCDLGAAEDPELKRQRGWFPAFTPALRYFDTANFGKRVRCKVKIVRGGLADTTCPPSGGTVLYNNLTNAASRSITYIQGSDHSMWGATPKHWQTFTVPSPQP